jgi:hypothetical protein
VIASPPSYTTGCVCICYDCGGTNTGCNATYTIDTTATGSNYATHEDLAAWRKLSEEIERIAEELRSLRAKRAKYSKWCRDLMLRDARRSSRPTPPFVPARNDLYKTVRQMHAV